jgi:hypothetical protein
VISPNRRSLLRVLTVCAMGFMSACASTENREMAREIAPLVGHADKAYFLDKYGDPDKRTSVDNVTDVWEYTFGQQRLSDFGARSTLSTAVLVRLTFRNGILVDYRASNRVN